MPEGEIKRWEELSGLEPGDVCKNALAGFDSASGLFSLKSFRWEISVSPRDKKITGDGRDGDILLGRLGYFSRLAILWYLTGAQDVHPSGELVKPVNLRGGQLFFRGSHVLPLDSVAGRYCDDTEGFVKKGLYLGGEVLNYGDASVRLFPFPRVPVVIILWRRDDEFPARADLLLDTTCEIHLPLDIIWSTSMMSLLIML